MAQDFDGENLNPRSMEVLAVASLDTAQLVFCSLGQPPYKIDHRIVGLILRRQSSSGFNLRV